MNSKKVSKKTTTCSTINTKTYQKLFFINIKILVLGRSNVGKSSLINKLFLKDISFSSKKPGKTQNLEFFLVNYNRRDTGFIIDSPGFGYVNGPVILRKKFKYLIYSYINFGVRLNMILYLINGEYGIKNVDMEELEFLNKFNKKIQIVLTKVDTLNNIETVQYATQVSNFTKPLINVRREIFLTSSKYLLI
jgi:GTP-binding protein